MTIAQVVVVGVTLDGQIVDPHLCATVLVREGHGRLLCAARTRTLSAHGKTVNGAPAPVVDTSCALRGVDPFRTAPVVPAVAIPMPHEGRSMYP
jgi:hypothetical protein